MRITQNQIAHMLMNQSNHSEGKNPEVGSLIKGEILKLQGQMVTISHNGKPLNLQNQSQTNFQLGDIALFEVVKSDQEGIVVKQALSPSQAPLQVNEQQLLSLFGMPDNADNRQVAKALLQYDLPLTPASFSQVKSQVSQVNVLLDEINKTGVIPKQILDKQVPLKTLVLQLMRYGEDSTKTTQVGRHSIPDTSIGLSEKASAQTLSSSQAKASDFINIESSKTLEGSKEPHAQTPMPFTTGSKLEAVKVILNQLQEQGGKFSSSNLKAEIEPKSIEVLKMVLSEFNNQKSALIVKRGLDFNVSNLLMLALEEEGHTLHQSAKELSQKLLSMKGEILKEAFQILTNDKQTPEEKIENLAKMIASTAANEESKASSQASVHLMKEMSQVIKSDNPQFYMMEVPLKHDDFDESVKVYYNKKQQNNDKSEAMTLLIALKTHTLDEVRCVIQKKANDYDLSFRLKDEKIVKLFKANEFLLQESLNRLERGRFICHFIKDDDTPSEVVVSETTTYGFDVTV